MSIRPRSAVMANRSQSASSRPARPTSAQPQRAALNTQIARPAMGAGGASSSAFNGQQQATSLKQFANANVMSSSSSYGLAADVQNVAGATKSRVRPHSAVMRQRADTSSTAAGGSFAYSGSSSSAPFTETQQKRVARPLSAMSRLSGTSSGSAKQQSSMYNTAASGGGGDSPRIARPLSAVVALPPAVIAAAATRRAASLERQKRQARARHLMNASDANQMMTEIFFVCDELQLGGKFMFHLQQVLAACGADLGALDAIQQSLVAHKRITLHVLRKIEARERVMGCLNQFIRDHTVGSGDATGGGVNSIGCSTAAIGIGMRDRPLGEKEELTAFRKEPLTAQDEAVADSIIASLQACTAQVLEALAEWRTSADTLDAMVDLRPQVAMPTATSTMGTHHNTSSTNTAGASSPTYGGALAASGGGITRTYSTLSAVSRGGDAHTPLNAALTAPSSAVGSPSVGLPPPAERRFLYRDHDYVKKMQMDGERIRRLREVWSASNTTIVRGNPNVEGGNNDGRDNDSLSSSMSSMSRLEQIRQQMEEDAAVTIQRAYRGHRARLRYKYHKIQSAAARRIQQWYRRFLRHLAAAIAAGRHMAACRIQAAWRGCIGRQRYASLRIYDKAARVVQRSWRTYAAHMYWAQMVYLKERVLEGRLAIVRWFWSLKFKRAIQRHRETSAAALVIQRWFRSARMIGVAIEAIGHEDVLANYDVLQAHDADLEQTPNRTIKAPVMVGGDADNTCDDTDAVDTTMVAAPAEEQHDDSVHTPWDDGGVVKGAYKKPHERTVYAEVRGDADNDEVPFSPDAANRTMPALRADTAQAPMALYNGASSVASTPTKPTHASKRDQSPSPAHRPLAPPPAGAIGYTYDDIETDDEEGDSGDADAAFDTAVDASRPSVVDASTQPYPAYCRRVVVRPQSAHEARGTFYDTDGTERPPIVDRNFWCGDREAAMLLQRVGRGLLARLGALRAMAAAKRDAKRRAVMAAMHKDMSTIQAYARGKLSSHVVATTWTRERVATVLIQRWWRRWRRTDASVSNRRHREYLVEGRDSALDDEFGLGAARHVEMLRYRKQQAERISAWTKRHYDRLKVRAEAHATICRAWAHYKTQRMYFLRKYERKLAAKAREAELLALRAEEERQRKLDAGLVILYYYLKYRVNSLMKKIDAICEDIRSRPDREANARVLQRFWKATVARLQRLKLQRIRAKVTERTLQEERLLHAAIKVQSLYRLVLARKRVEERRRRIQSDRNYAAIVLQRNARMFLAKVEADTLRLGHLSMYREYRMLMHKSENMGWVRHAKGDNTTDGMY